MIQWTSQPAFNIFWLQSCHLCDVALGNKAGITNPFWIVCGFRITTLWPIPVCLDATETVSRRLEAGQSLALRGPEGFLLAILHVEDLWPIDHKN
ncbi:MAG: hypothetical protein V2B19_10965 [Pseudomonadota bacterium]